MHMEAPTRGLLGVRVARNRICALYAKGSGIARGQTLQVAVRKCMAETYFDVQKMILERDQRFFDVVISQIDLGNVDTCQV